MKVKKIHPPTLHKRTVGGHLLYTPVITVKGGTMVFVSGLLARDVDGNVIGKGDMAAQIRQVGENLEFFKHVEVRQKYLGPALPTRTTIEVRKLAHPDLLVEIEAFAVIA